MEVGRQRDKRLHPKAGEKLQEVGQTTLEPNQGTLDDESKYKNRKKSDKPGTLPEKIYLARNSLLTDLFEVNHGQAIYNLFVTILIVLFLNAAIEDVMAGKINLGISFIRWNLGEFFPGILIWLFMFSCTIGVYAMFKLWAVQRAKLSPNGSCLKIWDYFWLVSLVVYQSAFFYFPCRSVVRASLPPATALIVLTEQIRFIMKVHAFVRTNVPRVLSREPCPHFPRFAYFLFCPSLVYRDIYPRNATIRWRFVAQSFLEVIGIVFFLCYLVERFLVSTHRDYGLTPSTYKEQIVLVFGAMPASMLSYVLLFYCILHSWMNGWAEMLGYADRMFYQDWWNAKSYGAFYRRWNVIVHDWLFLYVFKDVHKFFPRSRAISTVAVFALSAIVHEYILAFTFGFFLPVMLFMFGLVGMSLVFVTSDRDKRGNVLVWFLLLIGTGFMTSLYCTEWYARVNCVQTRDKNFLDFFVPRFLTCVPIK